MGQKTLRKSALMHETFGVCAGHTCGECSNFVSGRYHDKILRKCSVYGLTHSEASDWTRKSPACGMFNREYTGRPIIELVGHPRTSAPDESLEGQIRIDLNEILEGDSELRCDYNYNKGGKQ